MRKKKTPEELAAEAEAEDEDEFTSEFLILFTYLPPGIFERNHIQIISD